MRNFEIYRDMLDGTQNYNMYNKKIAKYIDRVRDMVPPELLGVLNGYRLNLGDFSMKFHDWETNEFKKEEFENYIFAFCVRIETILMLCEDKAKVSYENTISQGKESGVNVA